MIAKYRAKRVSNGEWMYSSSLIRIPGKGVYMSCSGVKAPEPDAIRIDGADFFRVNKYTVGMKSRIEDSFGHMIYEGDIISMKNTYCGEDAPKSYYITRWRDDAGALVFTDNCGYMYNHMNSWNDHCVIKVEGNEWDDPELLKLIRDEKPDEFIDRIKEELKKEGVI